jgi:hypothetical protein
MPEARPLLFSRARLIATAAKRGSRLGAIALSASVLRPSAAADTIGKSKPNAPGVGGPPLPRARDPGFQRRSR